MSAQPEVLDAVETTAIADYSPTAAGLATLRQRFSGVIFDLSTTAGNKEARAARSELVSLRTSLEAKRVEIKAPVLERTRLIDAEAKRLTAAILELENPIDAQIKAEEKRKAEIKAEAERIAAEQARALAARREAQMDCITGLNNLVAKGFGYSVSKLAACIEELETEVQDVRFWDDDLLLKYEAARSGALSMLRATLTAKESAQAEADRIKKEADALAAAKAEQARQEAADRARIAAEQKAAADAETKRLKAIADAEEARLAEIRAAQEAELAKQRVAEEAARAERARLEAIERAELDRQREEIAAAERKRVEAAEAEKREALRIEQERKAKELADKEAAEQAAREQLSKLHANAQPMLEALMLIRFAKLTIAEVREIAAKATAFHQA
jgi:colicin import membrane protein